ncbi:FkbM family methyltransferase [Candidatus Methylopumilus planktonicus]|uniref:FkbM family methyltransferase n=1 Tax=Candidatus Methylopumilus planktonicus TaxID=1581557 RepID=UPI00111FCCD4|nr:FkbM family methyltransferase [Candidatus Methylopumilus planktonicus]QDD00461.1 FkbM family methyltransferase [Candidatus Methylopumilus planktonicus]
MLSKKYLAIKMILKKLSKFKFLNQKFYTLANMYLDIEKGYRFSYHPDENGEVELLCSLSKIYGGQIFNFFDVGAHFGEYTDLLISQFQSYRGWLFDLSDETLLKCRLKHSQNKYLVINHLGLNDSKGVVEYRFYPELQVQNGISGVGPYIGHNFELRRAPSITGDQYCLDNNINQIHLLKIDTEGYDLNVLRGFDRMLSKNKIDIIQFEYNIKSSETHSMLGDFYKYLLQYDYVIGPLRQDGVKFRDFEFTQNDFRSGPNYIACKPKLKTKLSSFTKKDL